MFNEFYKRLSKSELFGVLIILLFVGIHFFIKTLNLASPSIWYDEAFSIYHAQFTYEHIIEMSLNDQNPPVYNIILYYWMNKFGNSIYNVRLLSVLFSLLSIPFLFYLAKKYINISAAIIASVLYLIWNELIYYSMEARCYSFVGFLVLTSIFLFLHLMLSKKFVIPTIIALSIVNVMLILSHYLSVFLLVSQFVYFIIFYTKNLKLTIKYLISVVISILLFIPWFLKIIAIIKLTSGGEYWLKAATIKDVDFLIIDFFNNYLTFCVVAITIIIGTVLLKKQKQLNKFYYLFLIWAILPAILSYITSQFIPVFLGRYILYSIFGFILLLAFILSNQYINKYFRYVSLSIIFILLVIEIDLNPKKNQDIKSAVEYIKQNTDDKTLIIISPRSISIPFTYCYDSLLFRNFEYFEWELLKRNILLVDTKEELNRVNLSVYNKIINVKSFGNFFDTQNTIKDSLAVLFDQSNEMYYDDASIKIYENKNYHKKLKKIFTNFDLENISFYCPFNFIYTDSISYYKIQKGVKYNAVVFYNLNNKMDIKKEITIGFKFLLQSADNSVQFNFVSLDNNQNTILDTIIELNSSKLNSYWNTIKIKIPPKTGTKQIKFSFINSLENTDMMVTDFSIN